MNSNPKQCERIKTYLSENKKITQYEALNALGIMRLASRMSELKRDGYEFKSRMIKVKNRFDEICSVKEYYTEE